MLKYLLFIFALFFVFVLYTRKFVNPYKLIFIFGKKGAFKSTSMIREMKRHQKKGWTIYTDMKDCILPGVRIFDVKDLGKFIPPPRSCVFLDEVGITYDNRNWKNFPVEVRDYFKFQRKYKNKVYYYYICKDCFRLSSNILDKITKNINFKKIIINNKEEYYQINIFYNKT